jgi:hypothetical protein
MALRGESGPPLAVQLPDPPVAIVDGAGEMSGGAAGLSGSDGTVVHHDDGAPPAQQLIGRRESGDSRADHADIRRRIAG